MSPSPPPENHSARFVQLDFSPPLTYLPIHYNQEWIDSPSPIKACSHHISTTTATVTQSKFTTPSKPRTYTAYITPELEKQEKPTIMLPATPEPEIAPPAPILLWDVLWKILNTIVGKDKLAKVGQYTLRLVLHHAELLKSLLSDDLINIDIVNQRYNDREKRLDLLRNFIKHPQNFMLIVLLFVLDRFITHFSGFVGGLLMYRQFLRFGKTPFRAREMAQKVSQAMAKHDSSSLTLLGFLNDFLLLYYGVFDEMLLLYKLKFYTNKDALKVALRHEALAWYYQTILALYNVYHQLTDLTQQEMDLKVQIQVKKQARQLLNQILGLGNHSLSFKRPDPVLAQDLYNLDLILFKKNNAWLDVYKNLADLAFNTYTVFSLPLPFPTVQIWMGIAALALSTVKIFRETKRDMQAN